MIYTSGSTAMPKGVVCPHRQVLFSTAAIARRIRYRSTDRVFVRVPLSFDYGLYQLFLCAVVGASVYLSRTSDDIRLVRELSDSGATVLPVVPSLALMISRLARRSSNPYHVRLVTNTGGVVTPGLAARLREAFPGVAVVFMFGLTECKRVTISEPDADLRRPGCLGRPLDGTEIQIVRDDGTRCEPGEEGHLIVRGPHVMAGYLETDHGVDQRFATTGRPGWEELRTGDYGHVDDEGNFYFRGRRDDIFKRRSLRVSATEIEAAAIDLPGVTAAVAVPPAHEDALLHLLVRGDVDSDTVLRGLRARLEQAKIPDVCMIVDCLPMTSTGKVDRAAAAVLAARDGVRP
jgi:acyl-CoA synthetase (AMP-forming)/AMP-acid ligase II